MRLSFSVQVLSAALVIGGASLTAAQAQQAPASTAAATSVPAPVNGPASSEVAAAASRPVRNFYAALLYSMKHAQDLGITGRFKHLEPAVNGAFDFETMIKFTVGEAWKTMTPTQQKQLTAAFGRLTTADYASNFDGYNGETFTVSPKVELHNGDAIVSTEMTQTSKPAIPFAYRMHKTSAGWKIVDIYLNGYISEIAQRRADFQSTLQSGGADALVKKLSEMTDKILKP